MTGPLVLLPPDDIRDDYGPAMLALNDRQRRFVLAKCENPSISHEGASRAAGYLGEGINARVQGHRVATHPKVLAAMKEEAERMLNGDVLLATMALREIAKDTNHKDRAKVAMHIRAMAGLTEISRSEVVHRVLTNDSEKIAAITALAKTLGLDPKTLLGQAGVVTDAEFDIISPPRSPTVALEEDWTIE